MLTEVRIQNFRSIRDAQFTLAPLTVFVGPNGSGKTSILDALNSSRGFSPSDHWRHQKAPPTVLYRWDGGDWSKRDQSYVYQSLRLDLGQLRAPNMVALTTELKPNGEGLANLFGSLTRKQRDEVAKRFCKLVPTFADVDTLPVTSGKHILRFQDVWDPSAWYEPYEVSDGSMLVLALLLLPYQTPQPQVLSVEDLERGLHPYLLEQAVTLLHRLSVGDFGSPVQVLLATHSPQLLEFTRPDEVRFVDRDPKTGDVMVRLAPTNTEEWKTVYEEYQRSLGSLWLSGNLGGVPGA